MKQEEKKLKKTEVKSVYYVFSLTGIHAFMYLPRSPTLQMNTLAVNESDAIKIKKIFLNMVDGSLSFSQQYTADQLHVDLLIICVM